MVQNLKNSLSSVNLYNELPAEMSTCFKLVVLQVQTLIVLC